MPSLPPILESLFDNLVPIRSIYNYGYTASIKTELMRHASPYISLRCKICVDPGCDLQRDG